MTPDIQFTKNFSLMELLLTAHRKFDEEQYNPPTEVIENLSTSRKHPSAVEGCTGIAC
jgi:pyrrolidone-carboxylate peptidase